jgi:hypothetical protein
MHLCARTSSSHNGVAVARTAVLTLRLRGRRDGDALARLLRLPGDVPRRRAVVPTAVQPRLPPRLRLLLAAHRSLSNMSVLSVARLLAQTAKIPLTLAYTATVTLPVDDFFRHHTFDHTVHTSFDSLLSMLVSSHTLSFEV